MQGYGCTRDHSFELGSKRWETEEAPERGGECVVGMHQVYTSVTEYRREWSSNTLCAFIADECDQPGFKHGLSDTTLITHLAYSLHGSSPKLRSLTSDVLAAICYVSPTVGHKAVLSALSDYRVEYGEKFRFEELIGSLRPPDLSLDDAQTDSQGYNNDEEGAWEARTASMALVNAITNFPDSLEERILLREEFTRRGLNEVLVVRIIPLIHNSLH